MWLAQSDYLYEYNYTTSLDSSDATTGILVFSGAWLFFWLIVWVVAIIAMWKVFTKAGQPGWAAIVPIYNYYILLKIVGRPGWWLLLFFIPFVNLIVGIIVLLELGRAFGKSTAFSVVALILFSIIGMLILGFGKDEYKGVPEHVV
jgi:hypothetical protein